MNRSDATTGNLPEARLLEDYLKEELRVLNAHLPCGQRPLADLLKEQYPGVLCRDSNTYLFRKKELTYLAGLVNPGEEADLLLPILIEMKSESGEGVVLCRGQAEAGVISKILGMAVTVERNRITLYRPQLSLVRKLLRTTTQYLFAPG